MKISHMAAILCDKISSYSGACVSIISNQMYNSPSSHNMVSIIQGHFSFTLKSRKFVSPLHFVCCLNSLLQLCTGLLVLVFKDFHIVIRACCAICFSSHQTQYCFFQLHSFSAFGEEHLIYSCAVYCIGILVQQEVAQRFVP